MKRLILATLIFSVSISAFPATMRNFRHHVPLGPVGEKELYRITLTDEMLQKSAPRCIDVRIFDPKGTEIPYVIVTDRVTGSEERSYQMTVIDFTQGGDASVVTAKMASPNTPVNAMNLDIANNDFSRMIVLYGGNTRNNWTRIAQGMVYDYSSQVDIRKTWIRFPVTQYLYYQVRMIGSGQKGESMKLRYKDLDFSVDSGSGELLRINGITASLAQGGVRIPATDQKLFKQFKKEKDDKGDTIITLEADLPFDKISFDVKNVYFYRKILVFGSDTGKEGSYKFISESSIYSFPLSNQDEKRSHIDLSTEKQRFYRFTVINKNSPPLDIERIRLEWVRKHLFFVALGNADRYTLCLGNDAAKNPEYDLSNFISQENWYTRKYTALATAGIVQNRDFEPQLSEGTRGRIEKGILTAVAVLLVIGLGLWLYRLLGTASPS